MLPLKSQQTSGHRQASLSQNAATTKSAWQSALQDHVLRIIDSYLQVWARFVRLGQEDKVCKQIVSEVADWWLVWSLSNSELARSAHNWAGRGNPLRFSRTTHNWLSLQVFLVLKRNKVLSLTRLEAADRLIKRWNPFPFHKKAKALWGRLRSEDRQDLLRERSSWLLEVSEELAEQTRPWRFGPRWLKDTTGRLIKCRLEDLSLPKPVRAVRTAVCRRFESSILDIFAGRSLRDSDGAIEPELQTVVFSNRDGYGASSQDEAALVPDGPTLRDDSPDVLPDDSLALIDTLHREHDDLELLERCPIFTRRERELISHRRQGLNLSDAAREMGIKPETGWVHWHNIKQKRPRARVWLRTHRR